MYTRRNRSRKQKQNLIKYCSNENSLITKGEYYSETRPKGKNAPYLIQWGIIIATALGSIATACIAYHDMHKSDKAVASIINIQEFPHNEPGVLKLQIVITNSGTNPLGIVRVSWYISELPDPFDQEQLRVLINWTPNTPEVVQGGDVRILNICMNEMGDSNKLQQDTYDHFYRYVPDALKDEVNFGLALHSTIVIYASDSNGDLHKIPIYADIIDLYGGHSKSIYGIGIKVKALPLKAQLLCDDTVVQDKYDYFNIRQDDIEMWRGGPEEPRVENWICKNERVDQIADKYR